MKIPIQVLRERRPVQVFQAIEVHGGSPLGFRHALEAVLSQALEAHGREMHRLAVVGVRFAAGGEEGADQASYQVSVRVEVPLPGAAPVSAGSAASPLEG